ncbi:UNVERIFIED_CONTAM: hypothetical protein FKN15_037490 [Acipenser sinensis]
MGREEATLTAQRLLEEPFLFNPLLSSQCRQSQGLETSFVRAGIIRLAHLMAPGLSCWLSVAELAARLGWCCERQVERVASQEKVGWEEEIECLHDHQRQLKAKGAPWCLACLEHWHLPDVCPWEDPLLVKAFNRGEVETTEGGARASRAHWGRRLWPRGEPHQSPASEGELHPSPVLEGDDLLLIPPLPEGNYLLLPPPVPEGDYLLLQPPAPEGDYLLLPPPTSVGYHQLLPPPPPEELDLPRVNSCCRLPRLSSCHHFPLLET